MMKGPLAANGRRLARFQNLKIGFHQKWQEISNTHKNFDQHHLGWSKNGLRKKILNRLGALQDSCL